MKQFCISLAVRLQKQCIFARLLQFTCEYYANLHLICSLPASNVHICLLFAVVLQIKLMFASYVQLCCKYYAYLCIICSSPANMMRFFVFFAVVLQIEYGNKHCLQLSCKWCAIVGERVSLWEQDGMQWFHCMPSCCCFAQRVGGLCRFVFLARSVWDGAWKLFFWFLLYWGYLMRHIALPINHEERGERQCYDEPNETKQGAPHRERQQQNGGIEPHGFTHDFWGDNHVGNHLNDGKNE